MPLSNKQKITFLVLGLIILILVLGFLGVIPGIKKSEDAKKKLVFTLNVWLVNEDHKSLSKFLNNFKKDYPKGKVNFRSFQINNLEDYKKYENALLNALAEGRGPDIFMIKNNQLFKYINKLYPLPQDLFNYNFLNLQENFPKIVVQDFYYQNNIFGLPLSGDLLVLAYNQDIFNKSDIFILPEDWQNFLAILKKLPVNEDGRIRGAAFGLDLNSYPSYGDLFLLLSFQKNALFYSKNKIDFNKNLFKEVVNFYLQFSDNLSEYYSWNVAEDKNVLDAFKKGDISMLFGYYNELKNNFVNENSNFSLTFIPQFDLNNKVNFLSYYSFVVSKQSKFKNLSWDFILKLTHDQNFLTSYLKDKKIPMNKKFLVVKYNDSFLDKAKYSILTANNLSFFDVDGLKEDIFNSLIKIKNKDIDLGDFIYILEKKYKFY